MIAPLGRVAVTDERTRIRASMLIAFTVGSVCLSLPCAASPPPGDKYWFTRDKPEEGYSVQLNSISPMPGTPLTHGTQVHFVLVLSYQLRRASHGRISISFQDEHGNIINPAHEKPAGVGVEAPAGTVTIEQTLQVPKSGSELTLVLSPWRDGTQISHGGALMRYPMSRDRQRG